MWCILTSVEEAMDHTLDAICCEVEIPLLNLLLISISIDQCDSQSRERKFHNQLDNEVIQSYDILNDG